MLHAPGEYVTTPCELETCPWPKQLFFEDDVSVRASFGHAMDLSRFPFDTQSFSGSITIASNFVSEALREQTTSHHGVVHDYLHNELAGVYAQNDWIVTYAHIESFNSSTDLNFDVQVKRNAKSAIFKVLIPILANSILIVACSTSGVSVGVLTAVGISIVGASYMLNPATLGLPADVEGVPFVLSLVIIHLCICALMLFSLGRELIVEHFWSRKILKQGQQPFNVKNNEARKSAARGTHGTTHPRAKADKKEVNVEIKVDGSARAQQAAITSCTAEPTQPNVVIAAQQEFLTTAEVSLQPGKAEYGPEWFARILSILPTLINKADDSQGKKYNAFADPSLGAAYAEHHERLRLLHLRMPVIIAGLYLFCWMLAVIIYFA